jgi:hypothetical protein
LFFSRNPYYVGHASGHGDIVRSTREIWEASTVV